MMADGRVRLLASVDRNVYDIVLSAKQRTGGNWNADVLDIHQRSFMTCAVFVKDHDGDQTNLYLAADFISDIEEIGQVVRHKPCWLSFMSTKHVFKIMIQLVDPVWHIKGESE